VRALEESAAMARRLADRSQGDLKHRFEDKEEIHGQQAELIRRILLRGEGLSVTDADDLFASDSERSTRVLPE
jgi:hypothetical protein